MNNITKHRLADAQRSADKRAKQANMQQEQQRRFEDAEHKLQQVQAELEVAKQQNSTYKVQLEQHTLELTRMKQQFEAISDELHKIKAANSTFNIIITNFSSTINKMPQNSPLRLLLIHVLQQHIQHPQHHLEFSKSQLARAKKSNSIPTLCCSQSLHINKMRSTTL